MIDRAIFVLLVACGGAKPAPAPRADARCVDDGDGCETCPCGEGARPGCAVTTCEIAPLDGLAFSDGSAELPTDADAILDAVAAMLAGDPDLRLTIVGNASVFEPDADALSLARAEAVRSALVARGVQEARLSVEGRGADDDDRRVDFVPSPG